MDLDMKINNCIQFIYQKKIFKLTQNYCYQVMSTMFASVTLINLCIIKENTKMKSIFE